MTTTKEETFDRRGISDIVRNHRRYLYLAGVPHEHDTDGNPVVSTAERTRVAAVIARDVARVRAVDPSIADDEYTAPLRSRVRQGAWAMPKHPAVPEYGPIPVQFKEDHPPLKTHSHWHGDFGPKARAKHVNGKRSGHGGIDTDDIHEHRKPAKYRMMPKPRRMYQHTHDGDSAPRDLTKHYTDREPFGHGGDTADPEWLIDGYLMEQHEHRSHRPELGDFENRLDMHPDVRGLLADARRVFFCLEGVLKADALLSAGEAVFDVPSVTLWDAPELEEFARKHLAGQAVYIVPDSDWASNMQVSAQAFGCRERLRSYGIDAHVAAPQPKCGRVCEHEEEAEAHKRGVDDFLADGFEPDDLMVLEREPSLEFNEWAKAHRAAVRRDRAANDIHALWWLALHASREDGTVKRSAQAMANHVGVDPSVLHDILVRLIEEGVIESSRPLQHTIRHRHRMHRTKAARDKHLAEEHLEGDPGEDDRHTHTRAVQRQVLQVRQKRSERYKGKNPRQWRAFATVVDWDRLGKDDPGPTFTVREDLRAGEAITTIREREATEARDVSVVGLR